MLEMRSCLFLFLRQGPWVIRIDGPGIDNGQRHIHIARDKLKGEYSWNIDGSRHDKHKFPKSEFGIKKAKKIASAHLGIPQYKLELVTSNSFFGPIKVFIDGTFVFESNVVTERPETKASILAFRDRSEEDQLFCLVIVTGE